MNEVLTIDINKLANDKLNELLTNGTVNKIIEKSLTGMVENACDSAFSQYGDISKSIEKSIKENIKIDLKEVDFATYNHNMAVIVKDTIESALNRFGIEKINKSMQEMLTGDIPLEMKLSELIKKFKEDVFEPDDDEISLHLDTSDSTGYVWVHFDSSSGKDKYRCKYKLLINKENKIAIAEIGGMDRSKSLNLGGLFGFDALLFRLYSAGSKITLDEDDVILQYESEES
jgi:hypothetical protein